MSPPEILALREYLGPELKGRTISDARHSVSLTDILRHSCLIGRSRELSGRSGQIPEAFANRLERGADALAALDRGLSDGRDFVAGEYSIADIALYAYVHCADDAGVDLATYEQAVAWLGRVEAQPRFENDLEPLPAHALQRPV